MVGWIGAAFMVCASFNMGSWHGMCMAIVGLSLLTVQACHAKMWNLVALNILSIIGFTFSLTSAIG